MTCMLKPFVASWKNYKKTEICVTRVANMDSQTNMITNGIKA